MKKLAIIGPAVTAVLATTAVAVAQYPLPATVEVQGKVTPRDAGTKKRPKSGALAVNFIVDRQSESTVSRLTYFMPRHVELSGRGIRSCSAKRINQLGPDACARASRIGSGAANVLVGAARTPRRLDLTVYAAGRSEIAVYLENERLGLAIALQGLIADGSAPYGRKVTIAFPERVQRTPSGYLYLTGVDLGIVKRSGSAGRGRKGRRTRLVGVTGCPRDGSHDFMVRLDLAANPNPPADPVVEGADAAPCVR